MTSARRRPGYPHPPYATPSQHQRQMALDATAPLSSPVMSSRARDLAEHLLGRDSAAHLHSQGAAGRAKAIERHLLGPWRQALVPAAWLHEIGQSAQVTQTGCAPLDAARYLRYLGWDPEICRLVAWQGAGYARANQLGLTDMLESEFAEPEVGAYAAINWTHLTTAPDGARRSVDIGLEAMLNGDGTDHLSPGARTATWRDVARSAARRVAVRRVRNLMTTLEREPTTAVLIPRRLLHHLVGPWRCRFDWRRDGRYWRCARLERHRGRHHLVAARATSPRR